MIRTPRNYGEFSLSLALAFSLNAPRFILLHDKFLQFDWLRAVVFQLNLEYLHVKITNLLRVKLVFCFGWTVLVTSVVSGKQLL